MRFAHPREIGPWLKKLREQRGIQAKEVALAIKHTQGYVSNVEDGRTLPSMNVLHKWFEYLSIDLEASERGNDADQHQENPGLPG